MMTNGDMIRSMTDDELAQLLKETAYNRCVVCAYEKSCHGIGVEADFCELGVEQWIKQEQGK